jgi:polyisoprenoid-binding protein YceI
MPRPDLFIKADGDGLLQEPKQTTSHILPTKLMDGGVMASATSQVVAGADLRADLVRGAFNGSWSLVPSESSVRLKAKAMWGIVPVKGIFSELAGSAAVAADGGVTGRLEVKSASINTKMKKRDEHLRSDDCS